VNSRKHRGFSAKLPGSAGFDLSRLDLDSLDLDPTAAIVRGLSSGDGWI
jgi:hypothetical protein